MSSNYKYKDQPLDEIAATYNGYFENKNNEVHNNIINNMCFKMSDNGFEGDDTLYIRKTDSVANEVWGSVFLNEGKSYKNDNNPVPLVDKKYAIFNGLDLNYMDTNAIINANQSNLYYDVYISYNEENDSITYIKEKYNEKLSYVVNDNKYLHIIEIQGAGGDGGDGLYRWNGYKGNTSTQYVSMSGGGGGGGGGFAAILIDISKIKNIHIYRQENTIYFSFENDLNTFLAVTDGEDGEDSSYLKTNSASNMVNTKPGNGGNGGSFTYNATYDTDGSIYIIKTEYGGNGGNGGCYTFWEDHDNIKLDKEENRPSKNGSNMSSGNFTYDNNQLLSFSSNAHNGGTTTIIDPPTKIGDVGGGGGGASYSGNGGNGGNNTSPFGYNGVFGGGGGGGKGQNSGASIDGGTGGSWFIRVYAEKLDGTCDFSNIPWETVN